MSRHLVIACLSLAFVACKAASTVTPHPLVIPGSSELGIGESLAIEDAPYLLRLDSVESDSRCPADVMCVWAGEVVVQATLVAKSGLGVPDRMIVLHGETAVVAAGMSIRITAVSPNPAPNGQSIPEKDYRFTVAIKRAP